VSADWKYVDNGELKWSLERSSIAIFTALNPAVSHDRVLTLTVSLWKAEELMNGP
jgi:hypothetical protein